MSAYRSLTGHSLVAAVLCALAVLLVPSAALAEEQTTDIWQIDCHSEPTAGRTHCPLPDRAQRVSIAELHSHMPCIFGESWGLSDTMLWTSGGCAARFTIETGDMPKITPPEKTDRPAAPHGTRQPYGYVNGRFQREA